MLERILGFGGFGFGVRGLEFSEGFFARLTKSRAGDPDTFWHAKLAPRHSTMENDQTSAPTVACMDPPPFPQTGAWLYRPGGPKPLLLHPSET